MTSDEFFFKSLQRVSDKANGGTDAPTSPYPVTSTTDEGSARASGGEMVTPGNNRVLKLRRMSHRLTNANPLDVSLADSVCDESSCNEMHNKISDISNYFSRLLIH